MYLLLIINIPLFLNILVYYFSLFRHYNYAQRTTKNIKMLKRTMCMYIPTYMNKFKGIYIQNCISYMLCKIILLCTVFSHIYKHMHICKYTHTHTYIYIIYTYITTLETQKNLWLIRLMLSRRTNRQRFYLITSKTLSSGI